MQGSCRESSCHQKIAKPTAEPKIGTVGMPSTCGLFQQRLSHATSELLYFYQYGVRARSSRDRSGWKVLRHLKITIPRYLTEHPGWGVRGVRRNKSGKCTRKSQSNGEKELFETVITFPRLKHCCSTRHLLNLLCNQSRS
jgi:hypothetical protein